MLNRQAHKLIIGRILKDIYSDISLSSFLGFKGGTCAYIFYKLPRFSVDLDFDLLSTSEDNQSIILNKIEDILKQYGQVREKYIKRFTILAILSYGDKDHNIKVEINLRRLAKDMVSKYDFKEYLGISMQAAKKSYLFGGKLAALTLRKTIAMRDIFDIHYFAANNWDIDEEVVRQLTGKSIKEQLTDCLRVIGKVNNSQIMHGLGELVESQQQKEWIKNNLKSDVIFMLNNYLTSLN